MRKLEKPQKLDIRGIDKVVEFKFMLRCDERFTNAFTAYGCDFKEITLV